MRVDAVELEIQRLRLSFAGRPLLDGVTFTLNAGERLTLTGPSGIGKSSLLKAILGFITPEQGDIRIRGEALSSDTAWRLRRHVGYVMQEADLGNGRAKDLIAQPFSYRANRHLRDNLRRTAELCERLLLPADRLDENIETLSGGEKQRIALIAALLLDRPVLLLDEASSALDPESRAAVAAYLRDDAARTVLSVAHDPDKFPIGGEVLTLPSAVGRRA